MGFEDPNHPMHRPARGTGTRPPFEKGHKLSLKYGAFSPSIRDPVADQIVSLAVEHAPHLADPTFTAEVAAWSRAEAACLLIGRYLDEHGVLDDDGEPRNATKELTRFEKLAADRRIQLGLTPLARARISADLETRGPSMVVEMQGAVDDDG